MSDSVFQWSLTALTGLVIAWVILAITFGLLDIFWAIVSGLAVEILAGGILLRIWGKSYMNRM